MKTTIAFITALITLALGFEFYSLLPGGPVPISQAVWHLTEVWDFFGPLCGIISGILICHFWWVPKCPKCGYQRNRKDDVKQ